MLTLLSLIRTLLRSSLFPYTTLFRSLCSRTRSCRPAPSGGGGRSGDGKNARLVPAGTNEADEILARDVGRRRRSEEHTSELQSLRHLVCRLLLEKKKEY